MSLTVSRTLRNFSGGKVLSVPCLPCLPPAVQPGRGGAQPSGPRLPQALSGPWTNTTPTLPYPFPTAVLRLPAPAAAALCASGAGVAPGILQPGSGLYHPRPGRAAQGLPRRGAFPCRPLLVVTWTPPPLHRDSRTSAGSMPTPIASTTKPAGRPAGAAQPQPHPNLC